MDNKFVCRIMLALLKTLFLPSKILASSVSDEGKSIKALHTQSSLHLL
jgi:hypothetical protein